jgi:hypothetical protein
MTKSFPVPMLRGPLAHVVVEHDAWLIMQPGLAQHEGSQSNSIWIDAGGLGHGSAPSASPGASVEAKPSPGPESSVALAGAPFEEQATTPQVASKTKRTRALVIVLAHGV